jgi:hypothetical protein
MYSKNIHNSCSECGYAAVLYDVDKFYEIGPNITVVSVNELKVIVQEWDPSHEERIDVS